MIIIVYYHHDDHDGHSDLNGGGGIDCMNEPPWPGLVVPCSFRPNDRLLQASTRGGGSSRPAMEILHWWCDQPRHLRNGSMAHQTAPTSHLRLVLGPQPDRAIGWLFGMGPHGCGAPVWWYPINGACSCCHVAYVDMAYMGCWLQHCVV